MNRLHRMSVLLGLLSHADADAAARCIDAGQARFAGGLPVGGGAVALAGLATVVSVRQRAPVV